jgi:hypothetical protein
MAADGQTCKAIAEGLNRLGYRTTGNRGSNLFTKDTTIGILRNRFYLGELPDGEYLAGRSRRGSYTKHTVAKHKPLISTELWQTSQKGLELNYTKAGRPASTQRARVYSLSGLMTCSYCGGKLHIHTGPDGKPKVYCYKRGQGNAPNCKQRSTFLSAYEDQVEQYLSSIHLPRDYQRIVLEAYQKEDEAGPGFGKQRQMLESKLKRLKALFTWGDLSEGEYREQRDQAKSDLAALPPATSSKKDELQRLASYLRDVGLAWRSANQEQRNRLARTLFEAIRVEDRTIKGVTPQIEFTPLLVLNHYANRGSQNLHPECQGGGRKCGSDGIRTRDLGLDRAAC